MPSEPPVLRLSPCGWRIGWGGAAVLLLPLWLCLGPLGARHARGGEAPRADPAICFGAFERAWRAASATRVVACMQDAGEVSVRLYGPPFRARWSRMKSAQARRALAEYFEGLRSGPELRDVTPRNSPEEVRLYEFTYRAAKADEATTLLSVSLSYDAKSNTHALASIAEKDLP